MARILAIGTATLDLVFTLTRYPAEDTEICKDIRVVWL